MNYVLELNNAWMPYAVTTSRNAFKLMVKGSAVAIAQDELGNYLTYTFDEWVEFKCDDDNFDSTMNTVRLEIPVPQVIISKKCSRIPKIPVPLTLENIWKRDGGRCGYCLTKLKLGEATRDHIYPQSLGGMGDWTNLVTSCKACNNFKADTILDELPEMELQYEVKRPNPTSIIYHMKPDIIETMPEFWKHFFVEFK